MDHAVSAVADGMMAEMMNGKVSFANDGTTVMVGVQQLLRQMSQHLMV